MTLPWLITGHVIHKNDQWVICFRMVYDSSQWRHYMSSMAMASIKIKIHWNTKNRLKNWKKIFLTNISKPLCLSCKNTLKTIFEKILAALYKKLLKILSFFSKLDKIFSKNPFSEIFVVFYKTCSEVFVWLIMSHKLIKKWWKSPRVITQSVISDRPMPP